MGRCLLCLYQSGARGSGKRRHRWTAGEFYTASAPRIILLVFAVLVVLYALRNLYPGRRYIRRQPDTWSMVVANTGALVLFYAYFYLSRNTFHPRSFFAFLMLFNVCYGMAFRAMVEHGIRLARRWWLSDRWPTPSFPIQG